MREFRRQHLARYLFNHWSIPPRLPNSLTWHQSGPDVVAASAVYDGTQDTLLIQGLADDTRYARGGVTEAPASDPIHDIQTVVASLDLPPALAGTTYDLTLQGSGTTVDFAGDLRDPGSGFFRASAVVCPGYQ